MRALSFLLLWFTVAAVNSFPGQQPLADLVTTQPIYTMEGWSYEDCGSWTSSFPYNSSDFLERCAQD